jgi:hypothetical protein
MAVMRLRFDDDDEQAAEAAREALVERFAAWLERHPERAPADAWDANLALDWKWAYGDGCYDRWTREEVDELLLAHLPRKLSADPEEAATIPSSIGAFVHFLDDEHLLDATGDTADVVAQRALAQQRSFLDAMADPANYGMAKRLFGLGGFDLGDEPDQGALDDLMAQFNALPFEERGRILGLDAPGDDADHEPLPTLSLRPLPGIDELEDLAGDVPLLAKVDALHAALGRTPAKLTGAGYLTLADARRLVAEVGLGDRVEDVRTAADLPELFGLVEVATTAGAAEASATRLRASPEWDETSAATRWAAVVEAVLVIGPATLAHGSMRPLAHELVELADEGTAHVLAMLWLTEEPVAVEVFVRILEGVASMDHRTAGTSDVQAELRMQSSRARVADVLAVLGSVGVVDVHEDEVTLTDHGARLAAGWLAALGFDVLLPEQVGVLGAGALIDLAWSRDEAVEELAPLWAAARPGRAAAELVAELVARPEPLRVALGFSMLGHVGPDAIAAVEGALDSPVAPHAWLFLAAAGAVDPDAVPPDAVVRAGIDTFLAMAEAGTPADAVEPLLGHLPVDDQHDLLDSIAATDHPQAGELLELLGRHHPVKAVGKHARKLAHRWRSAAGPAGRSAR